MSGFLASRGKIVCFGDSITQYGYDNNGGWVSLLAHHYTRKLDVINRGYSGYNTAHALFVLDKVIESYGNMNAEIVLVFFGANDANDDHIQGVPLDKYHSNLTEISQKLLAGGSRVILITPPAFDEDAYCTQRGFSECYRSNPRAKDYADAVSKVSFPVLNMLTFSLDRENSQCPCCRHLVLDGCYSNLEKLPKRWTAS